MIGFILSDLRRLWAGSLVVVLLIALATALGVGVTLQERALRLGSARAADKFDLVVGAAGSETQLVLSSVFLQSSPLPLMPGAVLAKLSRDPRVAWVAPIGFGDSFAGHPIIGTTRVLLSNTTSRMTEGRIFEREGEAVVGAAVKLALDDEVKPMHGTAETGGETHAGVVYRIVGRLPPTGTAWDRAILVPIQAVWHVHGLGHDDSDGDSGDVDHGHEHEHEHGRIDADAPVVEDFEDHVPGLPALLVKPKTIADAYRLRQDYRSGNTLAVFPGEVLTRLYATLGDVKTVLSAVAAGSQCLVAAALVLVTIIHIGQRRRQIGALRAFGAPRGAVLAIVWLELFLLAVLGIALGFLIGFIAAKLIAGVLTGQSGVVLPVEFSCQDVWAVLALLATSAILALLPALLAYRQSPAAALRA